MPRFKMLRGPEPSRTIELTQDKITIGRGRKNDIIIHDNEVSREHCTLVRAGEDYEIHDLNSTNGTFVNGQALDSDGWLLTTRCIVELGDSITLQYWGTNDEDTGILPRITQPIKAVVDDTTNYLVIHHRHGANDIYALDSAYITIGRDLNNDIVLPDAQVSRFHLRLVREETRYRLEDLNTLNGTYINDERVVKPQILKYGQHIRLGTSVELWYTNDPRTVQTTLQIPILANDLPARGTVDPMVATHRNGLDAGQLEDHVFIVYARAEWQTIVAPLYQYLQQNGVPTFVEQFYNPDSKEWKKALEQAQAECLCLVMILSDLALEIPHVQRSLRHFIAREKPILLVQYGDVLNQPMTIDNMPAVPYDINNPQRTFRMTLAEIRKLNNTLLT